MYHMWHYCPCFLVWSTYGIKLLGVYDALQKKYLKTLLFCICEREEGPMIEEYTCKFPPVELHIRLDWGLLMCCSFPTVSFSYPNTSTEEVAMNMSRTGSKKGTTTFTSNASEVTPDQMRYSLTLDVNFLAWACSLCKRASVNNSTLWFCCVRTCWAIWG